MQCNQPSTALESTATTASAKHSSKPGPLLRWLLAWTAVTTVPFWLISVRSLFDGASYEWSYFGFGGAGLSSDYWLPAVAAVLAIALRYLGWRGAPLPFHLMLVGWHLFLAVSVSSLAIADPGSLRLRGDSLGIDVSLAIAGPVLFCAWAALALWWAVRDFVRRGKHSQLIRSNPDRRWALALAALLPLQFVLLRFGPPGSLADAFGVIVTIAQWLLLGHALRPQSP